MPEGLEDVSSYLRLTEELLRRGYSETDVHKILGGNAHRAFRQAGNVAWRLQASKPPGVDDIPAEEDDRRDQSVFRYSMRLARSGSLSLSPKVCPPLLRPKRDVS